MAKNNFGTLMRDVRKLRELCIFLRRKLVGARRTKHERIVWRYSADASFDSLRDASMGLTDRDSRCELRWNDESERVEVWQVITQPADA